MRMSDWSSDVCSSDLDPNAAGAPFERQTLGKHVDARLGGTGMRLVAHRALGLRRRHRDERGTRGSEMRKSRLEDVEGADEVDLDDSPKSVGGHLLGAREEIARGARDDDVEPAEVTRRLPRAIFHRGRFTQDRKRDV